MMLTRCPHCGTTFRIGADQLKARQGRVRCGKCQGVFDALAALVAAEPAKAATPPPQAEEEQPIPEFPPQPEAPVEPAPVPEAAAAQVEAAPEAEVALPLEPEHPAVPEHPGEPVPIEAPTPAEAEPRIEPEALEELEAPAPEREEVKPEAEVEEVKPEMEVEAEQETAPSPETAESELPPQPESPAVQAPLPPAIAPEPLLHEEESPGSGRRWLWVLASLLALVALAAQALLHFRTEVIVIVPEARPVFAAVCDALGCELTLPHKIDLLGIETSELSPDKGKEGRLNLAATLRNRVSYALAWPHLEITLTDAQDRALLRRVLAPAEYLPAGQSVAAGFPGQSEQAVQLTLDVGDTPAVGYRLYIFHP